MIAPKKVMLPNTVWFWSDKKFSEFEEYLHGLDYSLDAEVTPAVLTVFGPTAENDILIMKLKFEI